MNENGAAFGAPFFDTFGLLSRRLAILMAPAAIILALVLDKDW
jgi:hypothetical protein